MDNDELAKKAYDAYGAVTDHKNYQGLPMPAWEDLTPKIQEAWRAASKRVFDEACAQAAAVASAAVLVLAQKGELLERRLPYPPGMQAESQRLHREYNRLVAEQIAGAKNGPEIVKLIDEAAAKGIIRVCPKAPF